MAASETFETRSARGTVGFGRRFAERLGVGDCVALVGELGAGKTVLVRGIAAGLGLDDERLVSSPTFVLVREYPARVPIYHVDLYRLGPPAAGETGADASAELAGLGIEEMLVDGVVLIEWADRARDALPSPHWRIEITPTAPRARRFDVHRV